MYELFSCNNRRWLGRGFRNSDAQGRSSGVWAIYIDAPHCLYSRFSGLHTAVGHHLAQRRIKIPIRGRYTYPNANRFRKGTPRDYAHGKDRRKCTIRRRRREEGEKGLWLQEPAGHAIQLLSLKQAAAGDGSSRS